MHVKAETGDPVLKVKDVTSSVSPDYGHKDAKPGRRMILLTILFSMVCKGTMVVILAPFFPAEVSRFFQLNRLVLTVRNHRRRGKD